MPATAMFSQFREIWLVDFEFDFGGSHEQGELPRPLCLVAREFRSGRIVRQWRSEFGPQPPYPTDPGVLFVAYYASAELGCHLALRWPMPARILDLYVEHRAGSDGRNRTLLSAFQARTGRNQPSNSRSIFGPSVWLRGLIRPKPGTALVYIDWGQQEFGIGAALSEDPMMLEAYNSGDPYLEFAKQAGAVPPNATKDTYGEERELYKACALAVQYGMGEQSLAYRIGRPPIEARELLRKHHETYRRFWQWSDRIVTHAMVMNRIHTVFGWPLHVSGEPNERSLRNFPMQANGAEMLWLACCLATERGIRVCMPVHDAILIEADMDNIGETVEAAQLAMAEASRVVLNGFELRSDVKVVQPNERYSDKRGETMWNRVMHLLAEAESWAYARTK